MAVRRAVMLTRQSTISGNSATSGMGGGILIEGNSAAVTILQSTIAENTASTYGGGVRIAVGNALLHNTIVADNSAATADPDLYGEVLPASSHYLTGDGTGLTSLTVPEDNTTACTFDPLVRVAAETITVSSNDLVRTVRHDAAGNLSRKIDRNGRVIDFAYDSLSRKSNQAW